MRAGAASAIASEIDPYGIAACRLNADANGVSVTVVTDDLIGVAPPAVDFVLVGDLFYDRELARRVTAFLEGCRDAGIDILIGDPRRTYLPQERLRLVAEYSVPDVGDVEGAAARPAGVFAFTPQTPHP
jgi:predicted nicotinamide N-methyase